MGLGVRRKDPGQLGQQRLPLWGLEAEAELGRSGLLAKSSSVLGASIYCWSWQYGQDWSSVLTDCMSAPWTLFPSCLYWQPLVLPRPLCPFHPVLSSSNSSFHQWPRHKGCFCAAPQESVTELQKAQSTAQFIRLSPGPQKQRPLGTVAMTFPPPTQWTGRMGNNPLGIKHIKSDCDGNRGLHHTSP